LGANQHAAPPQGGLEPTLQNAALRANGGFDAF